MMHLLTKDRKRKLVPVWMQEADAERVAFFSRTETLPAASAATGVTLVADSEVPAGYVPVVTNYMVVVNGATAWTRAAGVATVTIQDTNNTPVAFVTALKAALTANAVIDPSVTSNVTRGAEFTKRTGGTAGKGLKAIATNNPDAGSDLVVTVEGFYKKAS